MRKTFIAISGLVLTAASVQAATVGYTESFNSGLNGWGGGSDQVDIVASGGVGGGADGYLVVSNTSSHQLGARNQTDANLLGDLAADGVTGISFYLSELSVDDGLEIHVGVGAAFSNVWISNAGFSAPTNGWALVSVDLTDASQWTQTQGAGTFADALASSDFLLFRHDVAPLTQFPEFVTGDFGVDEITMVPEPASLLTLLVAGCLLGTRRR